MGCSSIKAGSAREKAIKPKDAPQAQQIEPKQVIVNQNLKEKSEESPVKIKKPVEVEVKATSKVNIKEETNKKVEENSKVSAAKPKLNIYKPEPEPVQEINEPEGLFRNQTENAKNYEIKEEKLDKPPKVQSLENTVEDWLGNIYNTVKNKLINKI